MLRGTTRIAKLFARVACSAMTGCTPSHHFVDLRLQGPLKGVDAREIRQQLRSLFVIAGGPLSHFGHEKIVSKSPLTGPVFQQVRHAKVVGADVKRGNVIERKGRMYQVLSSQHTTQGRGGATIQVELRDVQTGLKTSERLRTSEAIERVFVDEQPYTYLYTEDGGDVVLMEPSSFEQMSVPGSLFGDTSKYLTDGMVVTVQSFNGNPLAVSIPARITCHVTEADPHYKGQSVKDSYKRAMLENGIEIQVPSFVEAGDFVVVQTEDGSYVERAKGE